MIKTAKRLVDLLPDTGDPAWIIDGGCHVGRFSRQVLEAFPRGRVLAFEPDPVSAEEARRNVAAPDRFELVPAALGSVRGRAELFRGPVSATNSLLPRPEDGLLPYYPEGATLGASVPVDVVTLDDECAQRDITHIALAKFDLQGGELQALKGAERLLSMGHIRVLLVETVFVQKYRGQPLLWEVWGHLDARHYSLYSLFDVKVGLYQPSSPSLRDGQWNQCDAIFISEAARRRLDAR
jgi:FkbM family methyltransferase